MHFRGGPISSIFLAVLESWRSATDDPTDDPTDAMTAESPPCAGVSTAARHFQPMIRLMQETAMRAAGT